MIAGGISSNFSVLPSCLSGPGLAGGQRGSAQSGSAGACLGWRAGRGRGLHLPRDSWRDSLISAFFRSGPGWGRRGRGIGGSARAPAAAARVLVRSGIVTFVASRLWCPRNGCARMHSLRLSFLSVSRRVYWSSIGPLLSSSLLVAVINWFGMLQRYCVRNI